ncbi:alpha/beta hydrolase [Martelella sp. HB161492]|uniref:alpha/beta hydrolase n=1 Tax=Martelella sp. HB161492 TaxID=2720726 RepID=UPI001AEF2B7A|nr:alpha/beta hydrolase [Martelella sp. HB161492]
MAEILERLQREDRGLADPTTLAPAEGRALAEATNRRWNQDLPVIRRSWDFTLDVAHSRPLNCRLITPSETASGLIVFIHGGGWAFCSMETHEYAARLLALSADAHVLTFDYRLAPEFPFPTGLDDCVAVFQAVLSGKGRFARINRPLALAGDSAGANLALATMLTQIEHGGVLPDCGLLFYGVYDDDFRSQSYIDCENGPGLTRAKMMRYWDFYTPDRTQRENPLVAPLRADDRALAALPPLYINAAAIDPLRSDSEKLAERLAALGRQDFYRLHGGVVHGFMQMGSVLAEARSAAEEAAKAFREFTGTEETT